MLWGGAGFLQVFFQVPIDDHFAISFQVMAGKFYRLYGGMYCVGWIFYRYSFRF